LQLCFDDDFPPSEDAYSKNRPCVPKCYIAKITNSVWKQFDV